MIRLSCINQSINQSVKPVVAELLLGKVRNEKKKTNTNKKTAMKTLSSEYDIGIRLHEEESLETLAERLP